MRAFLPLFYVVFGFILPALGFAKNEDTIFDKVRSEPNQFLDQMYRESEQILALGESNHNNIRIFVYLKQLLEKHGTDPELKYLLLEKDDRMASFFETLSICPLEQVRGLNLLHLVSIDKLLSGQGMSADSYLINTIMPLIQKINEKRSDPLRVVAIDGFDLEGNKNKNQLGTLYRDEQLFGGISWNREDRSSRNFEAILERDPKPRKVIIVYHAFHLIQGIEARMPRFNSSAGVWEASDWHSMTWLGMYLNRKPEMRKKTKIVIFDEKDASKQGNWAPEGTFKLIQRQASRYPHQYFAIPLEPFRGEVLERGLDLFQPNVMVLTWFENLLQSNADIADMTDGVIWSPDAHINFQGALY